MSEVPPEPGFLARHRRLAIAAGVALALVVGVRVALPYALAWAVGSQAASRLGLVASVRNVDLGLFAGELVVEGLRVAPPSRAAAGGAALPPGEALLAWERVRADLDWTALLRGELRLTELALDGAQVRVERQPDGRIDVLAGAELPELPEEPEPPEPEADAAGGGLPFYVDILDLKDARLRLVDAHDDGEIVELDLAGLLLRDVSLVDGAFGLGGLDVREPLLEVDRERLVARRGAAPPEPPPAAEGEVPAPPLPAAGEAPAPPPEAGARPRPRHRIDELEIESAELTLLVGEREVDVALRLRIDDFAFETGAKAPIRLGIEIEGGSIDLDGRFGALPPFFEGALRWKDLPIPLFVLAARPDLASWLERCRSSGETEVDLRLAARPGSDAGPGLRVTGRFDVADLAAANPGDPELAVAWESLDVSLREVTIPMGEAAREPIRVHLGTVTLTAPDVLYTNPSTALATLLGSPAEGDEPPEGEAAPPPRIQVDQLTVRGGHVSLADRTVSPPFSGEVRALEVAVSDLALPGAKTRDLRVGATLLGGSLLELKGHTGPDLTAGDLDLRLERLPLPPTNPYLASAGLQVTRGALSLDTRARNEDAAWKLDSKMTLHDFDLDPAGSTGFRDQVGLPLGTVLALLRDPGGDITLRVPLSLAEGGVDVEVLDVLVTALREALVGAASSPLKIVGGVLALGGELGLEPLAAEPGRAALAAGADERLADLANLLEARPTLAVTLAGRAGKKDRAALAEQILAERLAAGGELPELEDAPGFLVQRRVRGALEARAAGEVGPLDPEDEVALARWRDAVEVPPERYTGLAHARADVARAALRATGRVDAKRVLVLAPAKRGAPGVVLGFRDVPMPAEAEPRTEAAPGPEAEPEPTPEPAPAPDA